MVTILPAPGRFGAFITVVPCRLCLETDVRVPVIHFVLAGLMRLGVRNVASAPSCTGQGEWVDPPWGVGHGPNVAVRTKRSYRADRPPARRGRVSRRRDDAHRDRSLADRPDDRSA